MFLIVGLGNVGEIYKNTFHNVGFLVIDKLRNKFGIVNQKKEFDALVSSCKVGKEKLVFAKPTTFMNNSGIAVRRLKDFYKPDTIIIVHDDLDLPSGTIRIRTKGSAGTHNGMKSVLQEINDESFVRVRVGIDNIKKLDLADFVLSNIPKDSKTWLGIDLATMAIEELINMTPIDKVSAKYSK